jgi:hypothetical protein
VTPTVATLEKVLDALQAPKRTRVKTLDHLHSLLSELSSWEAVVRTGLRRKQEEVRKLEAASTTIRIFQPALVPGLLQTAAYADRVLTLAAARWGGAPDIPQTVSVRMERQGVLMDTSKSFDFVVTEAALRWRICPPDLMTDQLDRVAAVSRFANVDLRVLPFGADVPAVPLNSFVLFDDRLAIVETFTNELVLHDPRDLAVYAQAFEAFRDSALSGDEARALLERVATDYRQQSLS